MRRHVIAEPTAAHLQRHFTVTQYDAAVLLHRLRDGSAFLGPPGRVAVGASHVEDAQVLRGNPPSLLGVAHHEQKGMDRLPVLGGFPFSALAREGEPGCSLRRHSDASASLRKAP